MLQERLSGFAILSIEKEMLEELKYKNLVILHLKKKKKNSIKIVGTSYLWSTIEDVWTGPMA